MSVIDVRLQVALRKVCSTAAGAAVATAAVRAHEHGAQATLLHAQHLVRAAGTTLDGLGAGALEAKYMLAGYHAAVDEDRLVALIAAVDHRVQHLLADQAHLVVPLKAQHRLRRSARKRGESGRLQLRYVRLHVDCAGER